MKCTTGDGYAYACEEFHGVTQNPGYTEIISCTSDFRYPWMLTRVEKSTLRMKVETAYRSSALKGEYLTTIGMNSGPDENDPLNPGTSKFRNPRGAAVDVDGNVRWQMNETTASRNSPRVLTAGTR